jgi:ATP-binding cassette subfamily A (ABC1) protein 3
MYAAGTGVLSLLLTSPITESGAVLEYVHFSAVFLLLLCYGCAVLALCQLISKLFKQSHSAASAASAIIFFLSIPHGYIFTSWKDMSVFIKCLISLNPPVLLALGCDIMCYFEKLNLPVSLLTNMNRQVSLDDTIALADICNLLLLNMIFYLAVTWFVDTSADERNRVFESFFGINLNQENSQESSTKSGFRVENVSKNFESKAALSNVTFETPAEGVTALIGTNGAGKSTLMKLLAGFLSPSRGEVHDAGIEVGYCPQYNVTWPGLTVKEHFIYFNKLAGGNGGVDPNKIAKNVQLEEKQNARPEELSGGMLRKLTFGVAMSSNPRRILLDEPTSGLDPVSRLELWEIVKQLGNKTGTGFYTTVKLLINGIERG